MRMLTDLIGGFLRPLALALLLLLGLGLISANPSAGRTGAQGFDCKGFFNNAEWNRTLCAYSPARLWNMPVQDLVPAWVKS